MFGSAISAANGLANAYDLDRYMRDLQQQQMQQYYMGGLGSQQASVCQPVKPQPNDSELLVLLTGE